MGFMGCYLWLWVHNWNHVEMLFIYLTHWWKTLIYSPLIVHC
jgi:hypothetical protein